MKRIVLLFCCMLAISACNSSQPQVEEKYQGRKETRQLEGASAVGYDGTAIRKTMDNTLNKTDDRGQEMNNELKKSSDSQK